MRTSSPVVVSTGQRQELESLSRQTTASSALVLRCRIVLLSADGLGNREIGRSLGCHYNIVGKWLRRWRSSPGVDGLRDESRSGRPCPTTTTGTVQAHIKKQRRSKDFLEFMDDVVKGHRRKRLCVIMDNLNTHTNKAAQEWLAKHPLVTFHYTPTHASWVNLIECFFSILTRQGLQQAVHTSARELTKFLKRYVEEYNQRCGPFVWSKGPEKLKKIIQLTKRFQRDSHSYLRNDVLGDMTLAWD